MIIKRLLRNAVLVLLMQAVSGCSYIKGLFPDKERDYQFRTEIAPLIIPEDLKAKTISALPPQRTPQQLAQAAVAKASSEQTAPDPVVVKKSAPESASSVAVQQPTQAAVQPNSPKVSSLQIDQPLTQAARIIGRALSRQKIEVVERNIEKGYFYVRFDMHAIKAEDNNFWDELNFMFGEDPSNEQEYRISLQELSAQMTEVTVQDGEGKPISNQQATTLLRLIAEAINQDTANTNTDDNPAP